MTFVSAKFLIFLAVTYIAYCITGKVLPKYQWIILLISSIYFYTSSAPKAVIILLLTTVITWVCALEIKNSSDKNKKFFLYIALTADLLPLLIFKYLGPFADALKITTALKLALPLGISFYTFQNIGYCIDIYRGMAECETNPLKYITYASFFPQICQGPISNYSELAPQLFDRHEFDTEKLIRGSERMLLGYFKKIVIANHLGNYINGIYSSPAEYSGLVLAFATFLYAIQLYADFSGYMDIVCGFSEMLGIRIAENFETPYFSHSISEFWRRWHISLGAWFRNYLYYPIIRSKPFSNIAKKLKSNGKKKAAKTVPAALALFFTWLLIGLWHGAGLNFILYGLYHGMFIILGTFLDSLYKKSKIRLKINDESITWKCFQIIRTFAIVCFGYVLFRSDSLETALLIYRRIFTENFYYGWSWGLRYYSFDIFFWITMAMSVLFCLGIEYIECREKFTFWLNRQKLPVRWGILYIMMFSIASVLIFSNTKASNSANFIYFNF